MASWTPRNPPTQLSVRLIFQTLPYHFIFISFSHKHRIVSMQLQHLLGSLAIVTAGASLTRECPPFPLSVVEFSSGFHQPVPPLIKPEFNTSFIQHKWCVSPEPKQPRCYGACGPSRVLI